MSDTYLYPGTRVLINKHGFTDAKVLDGFENRAVSSRIYQLDQQPIKGKFDLPHLQAIHKHLFQDVYDWAGKIRTCELGKNNDLFCLVQNIPRYAEDVFGKLKKENHLKGLEKSAFTDRLADHFSNINALHPFREGNGRSTREFLKQLSRGAGYELDFSKVDKDAWNAASKQSFGNTLEPMKQIFSDVTRSSRAIAFETLEAEQAVKRFPELAAAYAVIRAGELVAAKLESAAGKDKFMAGVRHGVQAHLETGKVPTAKIKELVKVSPESAQQDLKRNHDIER